MSNAFVDHGVEFSIPEEWTDRGGHWIASDGTTISLKFHHGPLDTAASLLDTYCLDLRLDAARHGGGLIECEKSQIGLTGVIKRPREDEAAGFAFDGCILAPIETGYIEFHVSNQEEDFSGDREIFVIETKHPATYNDGNLIGWQAYPYGHRPSREAFFDDLFGHKINPLLKDLQLFARSDDPKYDKDFPDHPLSRVRSWLAWLNQHVAIVDTPFPHRRNQTYPLDVFELEAPPGFIHNTETKVPGEWFERPTFNGRVSHLGIVLHPEFPDAFESVDRAESAVLRGLDESAAELLDAPVSYEVEVAGRPGILTACEISISKKDFFDVSFFLPWENASMEVAAVFESDDFARAMLNLEAVLPTIKKI